MNSTYCSIVVCLCFGRQAVKRCVINLGHIRWLNKVGTNNDTGFPNKFIKEDINKIEWINDRPKGYWKTVLYKARLRHEFKPWMMSSKWRITYRIISIRVISIASATCRYWRFLQEHTKSTLKIKNKSINTTFLKCMSLGENSICFQIDENVNTRHLVFLENMHRLLTWNCHLEATRNCFAWSSWHPVANMNWLIITCSFKPSITFICSGLLLAVSPFHNVDIFDRK